MVTGVQEPSVRSVPAYVSSRGREALEVAESVGFRADPFQELVLVDACGCRADGKWAAFEVGVNMPRQNGKGGILEVRELAGILAWGERLIVHSSHEFQTSMEAMLRMEDLLAADPSVSKLVKSVSRSHGSEGFVFKSGQRLRYRTRTKGGGRGFTGDTLVLDEAMVLQESFIGALVPTLAAKSISGSPQVLYMGSAVDQLVQEHGLVFARLRERGLRGDDPSLAYFEWSASGPLDSEGLPMNPDRVEAGVLDDEEAWARANPSLGIRISAEHVEKERRSMDARTFAVERLGIGDWPRTDAGPVSVVSFEDWLELEDEESSIAGDLCLAFDVTPARTSATIVAAGARADGLIHVEVVEHRPGTGWLVRRLREIVEVHRPRSVMCDAHSPAAAMLKKAAEARVDVETLTGTEYAQACGRLVDAVSDRTVRHLGQSELNAALKGAETRPLGDAWAWSRKKSSIDISPLVAASIAFWAAEENTMSVYADRGVLAV